MVFGVGGILLDESALLSANDDARNATLTPGAEYVLRKLRYSSIRTGIACGPDISSHKVDFLSRISVRYSLKCYILNRSSNGILDEITETWGDVNGNIVYLVSCNQKELCPQIRSHGWVIVVFGSLGHESADDAKGEVGASSCANVDSSVLYVNKLEEFPLIITHLNRKAIKDGVVSVGYIMKPSREEDFAKRGAFPMLPTKNGLIFVPLTFDLPISFQLQEVDIVLHKATDEIISIELNHSSKTTSEIVFSKGMQELRRNMEGNLKCCAIDPLENIYPVLDRLKMQKILLGLEDLTNASQYTIRGPHFLQVQSYRDADLTRKLSKAMLTFPSIVKPQVACGVADAHNMAIVFRVEDYADLNVPLPAVIQEYVNHSSSLFKFYVLGDKVFHAVKRSTPSANYLMKLSEKAGYKPLLFDSLRSLPIAKETQQVVDCRNDIDLDMVTNAARWLRNRLNLTIFGFDVVVQEGTGDHVIIDVNYLPSFKEIPDDIAIPAFWDAIKEKFLLNCRS